MISRSVSNPGQSLIGSRGIGVGVGVGVAERLGVGAGVDVGVGVGVVTSVMVGVCEGVGSGWVQAASSARVMMQIERKRTEASPAQRWTPARKIPYHTWGEKRGRYHPLPASETMGWAMIHRLTMV